VDTKKKEQLGQLPAAGREWRPKGDPVQVEDHSFFTTGPDVPVAVPYGIYDLSADSGWVNVGIDHDTSAFAVASIRRWWQGCGTQDYPDAKRLLITADAGGSNSYRYRLWKAELAALAAETGLSIKVCHFPPGTSKWNKIEHRLFSQITMNWRGRPLTSHEVVVATISSTRTQAGLRVHAELDTGEYPLGISVSREQLQALPIRAHVQHGAWNYTIAPDGGSAAPVTNEERSRDRAAALELLADERLTGMSRTQLAMLAAELGPAQAAQGAQRRFEQRGGPRRRAVGAGSRGLLTDADRVLVTVVYLRQACAQTVLSDLLGVNVNSIGQAIAETRQLLHDRRHLVAPSTLRFRTAAALREFVTSDRPESVRSQLPELLADPALTGISRADMTELIRRVRPTLDARNEGHRHRRRGGERMPGARGGVFTQKITDDERVLAAVLYQRRLCTQETLAELFHVSRRTIGNVVREVGPVLTAEGHTPIPATTHFANPAAVLDSIPHGPDTPTRPS
jgi:Rhodopirellula transposase DDE domain